MKKIRLGNTGLHVSKIGFGGIPITRPPEEQAVKVLKRAIELDINFFDSASGYGYGESEERIGRAIADHREQVVIATKTGALSKKNAVKSLRRSLKQLDTPYIDLWQLGNITTFEKYQRIIAPGGALEAAKEAIQSGQIRHVGISGHSMAVALEAVSSGHFETIQFPFNVIANEAARELIPLAREKAVGFIAMKPFAAGNISDANLAMKYLLQFDGVVTDPGIETMEELEQIVEIADGSWSLSPEETGNIEKLHETMTTRFCRHCEECLPCPQGVMIPELLYLPAAWKLRSSRWARGSVEKPAISWENCDGCGVCEERCPHELSIVEFLGESMEFYRQVSG